MKTTKNTLFPVIMISLALAIRQMSMTIVSPFISTYCKELSGYTPLLAGLVVGMFGLMQAILQIPFGKLSDRFGNKRVMIFGLFLVIIGFITAFFAKSMWLLIFARALQGSGAIIGVGYSWVAGIANEENQTKAMSILGGFISASAAIAFAVGPLLREVIKVNQMFLAGAVLLTLNTLYILVFLKEEKEETRVVREKHSMMEVLMNRSFIVMNIAAFLNNFMMMAVFYAAPIYMNNVIGQKKIWEIFIPAIVIAIVFMKGMVRLVDKIGVRTILAISFTVTIVSILFYLSKGSFLSLLIGTILYLSGYVTIATLTAAHVNEIVDDNLRGTGNGIFNSFQYIGSFAGALIMGLLWGFSEVEAWLTVLLVGLIGLRMMFVNRLKSKEE